MGGWEFDGVPSIQQQPVVCDNAGRVRAGVLPVIRLLIGRPFEGPVLQPIMQQSRLRRVERAHGFHVPSVSPAVRRREFMVAALLVGSRFRPRPGGRCPLTEKGPHREAGASGRALTLVLRVGATFLGESSAPLGKRHRARFGCAPPKTVRRRTENSLPVAGRIEASIDLASVVRSVAHWRR
jgi:hypothetical protein